MNILSIGECMIEFFCEPDGLWRRGFAGDTLNTAWAMRAVLPAEHRVKYVSRIGQDAVSEDLVEFIASAGIQTDLLQRDPDRTLGLYTIATDPEGERSFSYWRATSAARRVADDLALLEGAMADTSLIYLSGITAAIIGDNGREKMLTALRGAQSAGAKIAYDSNHRPALWGNNNLTREFATQIEKFADILLPNYEDEVLIFGDRSPEAALDRLATGGCTEIVLTNGADPVRVVSSGRLKTFALPVPVTPVDTTGAGDSFSGTYLAARLLGLSPQQAVSRAQAVAGTVVGHSGALVGMDLLRAAFQSLDA